MAKQIMPEATLAPQAGDISLPEQMFARISLFAQMKSPPSLDKFPGTVALRHYRPGEAICRHGEPGWTAFYILTNRDLQELIEYPERRLREAPLERAKYQEALDKFRLEKPNLDRSRGEPSSTEPEGLRKKLAALEREIEKANAALAGLEVEIATWPEAAARLKQQIVPTESNARASDAPAERFANMIREAETASDRKKAQWYRELQSLPPAKKRTIADALQSRNADLATILHELATAEDGVRVMATARLPLPRAAARRNSVGEISNPSLFNSIKNRLFGITTSEPKDKPAYIPIDAPRDVSYDSRGASLYEGDLFGEMSCFYRAPRSATVVAVQDCYVLEVLRNILEAVQKDPGHRARIDAALKKRLLESFLRELPIFSVLGEEQLARLHAGGGVVNFEPGDMICDEHEESDCMYLIGSGIVKVMKNVSWLIDAADIDEPTLSAELTEIAADEHHRAHWLYQFVSAKPERGPSAAAAVNELLKNPTFHEAGPCQRLLRESDLGVRTWQLMADPTRATVADLCRCNRQLIEAAFPGVFPVAKVESISSEGDAFRPEEVSDWKSFCNKLIGDNKRTGDPGRCFWNLLDPSCQEIIRAGATTAPSEEQRQSIAGEINQVLASQPLLLLADFSNFVLGKPQVGKRMMDFLPRNERWTPWMFARFSRAFHRLILESLLPKGLARSSHQNGPPVILAYRSRGEFMGEMGLMENSPRSATCVAYNHPDNDPEREAGPVQLVRIGKELFDELLATVPAFREKVAEVVATRKAKTQKAMQVPQPGDAPALLHSQRATELGLVEGQKLMLIDLDRCTRCDECVQACVSTHGDQRSRLFLNGPRFDKYLVPTTCRSCLDPVCMIGCPVGSIHRGGKGQIIIEDWCIGCDHCADQCPYGSIQMYDTGTIRENAHGWRYSRDPGYKDLAWTAAGFSERNWVSGPTPFRFDRNLSESLPNLATGDSVLFRYTFEVDRNTLGKTNEFTLQLTSVDETASVWLNGQPVSSAEKAKHGKRQFAIAGKDKLIRSGRNVLAIRVTLPRAKNVSDGDVLLQARLDEVRRPPAAAGTPDLTEKPVTHLAVVCDMCSSLPGGPACVRACPHDAAMRIDARAEVLS